MVPLVSLAVAVEQVESPPVAMVGLVVVAMAVGLQLTLASRLALPTLAAAVAAAVTLPPLVQWVWMVALVS